MEGQGNILITTLGITPAIITETIDKLYAEKIIDDLKELVIVTTSHKKVTEKLNKLLKNEFDARELKYEDYEYQNEEEDSSDLKGFKEGPVKIAYTPFPVRYNHIKALKPQIKIYFLPFEDIKNDKDNDLLFGLLNKIFSDRHKNSRILVSLAGGRKTMSAILYFVAQTFRADGIYHVLVDKETELSGKMHPVTEKITLVKLPSSVPSNNLVKEVKSLEEVNIFNEIDGKIEKGIFINTEGKMQKIYIEEKLKERLKETLFSLKRSLKGNKIKAILLTGETGVGKRVMAEFIHYVIFNGEGEFRAYTIGGRENPDIIRSEIFGHKKGAFTGAIEEEEGLVESIKTGTIFLDEIGDISEHVQTQLLNVIETGEYQRLGEHGEKRKLKGKILFVFATNKEDKVREDLKYRTEHIKIPPLRERKGHIIEYLVDSLRQEEEKRKLNLKPIKKALERHIDKLYMCQWKGNFRELAKFIDEIVTRYEYMAHKLKATGKSDELNSIADSIVREKLAERLSLKETNDEIVTKNDCFKYIITQALKNNAQTLKEIHRRTGLDEKTIKKYIRKIIDEEIKNGRNLPTIAKGLNLSERILKKILQENTE